MEFTRFHKLPTEIRLKIWGFCLPHDMGIVDIVTVQTAEGYRYGTMDIFHHGRMRNIGRHARGQEENDSIIGSTIYHESVYAASSLHHWFRLFHACTEVRDFMKKNFFFAPNSSSEIPRELEKELDETRRSKSKGDSIWVPSPPSAQHVESGTKKCANAMRLTMTPEISPEVEKRNLYYQVTSGPRSLLNRPGTNHYILDEKHSRMRFNPKIDVLFLANPRDFGINQQTSRLSTLLRWSDRDVLARVEMFAMSYSSWRKERCEIPLMLMQLTSLKRFWVCFVEANEEELDKVEGGWLAGVSGRVYGEDTSNSYFEQAQKEIMRKIPAWMGLYDACALGYRMPIVEVVRDRRELRRALDLLSKQ